MGRSTVRVLLSGKPGVGKTTLVEALAERLPSAGVTVAGFVTTELRQDGKRVGFTARDLHGDEAIIAHADRTGGPAVGRYRVDLAAFERIALPALERTGDADVVIVDELGPMELLSEPFTRAVGVLVESNRAFVATVHARSHPFTDNLRRRVEVIEVIEVTTESRDRILEQLSARFGLGVP